MSVKVSPLEAHLGYWLRYVSNQVSHAFAQKLAARDVTVAEWVMLRELYDHDPATPGERERGSITPSDLAERLGMTRGAISKLTDRLTAKGLVLRESNGDDRRYQAVVLTKAGHALLPALAALADQNDAEFFAALSEKERAVIEIAMKKIVTRLGLRAVPVD